MIARCRCRLPTLEVVLLSLLIAAVAAAVDNNAMVETRFKVVVSRDLGFGAQLPSPEDPLTIACAESALAVLLEDESLDWTTTCESSATQPNVLRCTNPVFRTVALSMDGFDKQTQVYVACRGTEDTDLSELTVSIPESSFTSPKGAFGDGVTRTIAIKPICDESGKEDGSLRSEPYFAIPEPSNDFACSPPADTSLISDVLEAGGICHWSHACDSTTCRGDNPIPASSMSVKDVYDRNCLYSVAPESLPPLLKPVMRADYNVKYEYGGDGCNFDAGTLALSCASGGELVAEDFSPICKRVDASTLECDANMLASGDGVFSCEGGSLEQLSPTARWFPDVNSVQCPQFGSLVRALTIVQTCDDVFPIETDINLGVNGLAVSCYPYSATYFDMPVYSDIDEETQEIHTSAQRPYEICVITDARCYPECSEPGINRMMAAIHPQHIDIPCLVGVDGAATTGGQPAEALFKAQQQEIASTAAPLLLRNVYYGFFVMIVYGMAW